MPKLKLIGIGGTNGSGKDTLGLMLAERYGFLFISITDMLRQELLKRNLLIERQNLHKLSAEWRREMGLGVLIDKAVEVYKGEEGKYKGLAVASLRNPGEADRIHELGGKIVWLDADPHLRYVRATRRQRSPEDRKTFDEFVKEEKAEMRHSGDEATLNLAEVKKKADIFITNDQDDLSVFKDNMAEALADYL